MMLSKILVMSLLAFFVFLPADGDAAEQRCNELGANCVCSEPMNTNSYPQSSGTGRPQNPADSTTKQCTYVGATGDAIEWLDCCPQSIVGASASSDPVVFAALPNGHTNTWVAKVPFVATPNNEGGMVGHNIGSTQYLKRVAIRWYIYYSNPYGFQSQGGCGNSKVAELGDAHWNIDSTPSEFNLYNFAQSVDCCTIGPGLSPDQSFNPDGMKGKWYRVEIVVTNRHGGIIPNGLRIQGFLKNVTDNTPEITPLDTDFPDIWGTWIPNPSLFPKVPIDRISINLHRYLTCSGYRAISHVMVAGWDTNQGQRIGTAYEIEGGGGGGDTSPPSAPANLQIQ